MLTGLRWFLRHEKVIWHVLYTDTLRFHVKHERLDFKKKK